MPITLLACLVAVVAAGVVALLTPTLLRWCPTPEDEEEEVAPFIELDSPRFRLAVFAIGAAGGCLALCLTEPAFWAAWVPFSSLGALLALIDLRTTFLPLRLNYLAIGLASAGAVLAAALTSDWVLLAWSAGGGLVAAALFWVVWRVSGGGLGFGDIRLAGLIGVVAGTGGPILLEWSLLLGTIVGVIWGLIGRLLPGHGKQFPYGPSLMTGPYLALLIHTWLVG